jgi:hypothetical protein
MIRKLLLQLPVKVLLISILLAGVASLAAAEWYDDYDEGVKAADSQNWATAEAKLKSALAHQAKQGKKVRVYGTRFMKYIPSYYLGIVYMNTGRYAQALEQFSIVQNDRLLTGSDPEFARMTGMIETAKSQGNTPPPKPTGPTPEQLEAKRNQQDAADLVEKTKGLLAQNKFEEAKKTLLAAKGKDPSNPSLDDLSRAIEEAQARQAKLAEEQKLAEQKQSEQQKRRDFDALITKSNQQLSSKNYAQARSLASQAAAMGLDNQRTAALLNTIDAAEKQEKDLQAKQTTKQDFDHLIASAKQAMSEENWPKARSFANAAKATGLDERQTTELMKQIDRLENQSLAAENQKPNTAPKPEIKPPVPAQSKQEDDALLAFYSGKYAESVALLQQLVARKPSARLYFYLGCNNAALAFLAGKQAGDPYKQKARENFAQAHKIDPALRPDEKFISPRIVQLFNQSL